MEAIVCRTETNEFREVLKYVVVTGFRLSLCSRKWRLNYFGLCHMSYVVSGKGDIKIMHMGGRERTLLTTAAWGRG